MPRVAKEQPRVCVGCLKSENNVRLSRGDDNQLRCTNCAAERRIELCPLKPTDLRAITRRADRCVTTVRVQMDWETHIDWLTFGEAQLRLHEKQGVWDLMAYLNGGATDFEHDSAYALSLPLIGLAWERLYHHRSTFTAWVHPAAESRDFRVPRSGYNPMALGVAQTCRRCTPHHPIVPEGHYQPPFDAELYKLVAGKRVEITIGTVAEPKAA